MTFLEVTMSRYGMVQHDIVGSSHDFVVYHNVSKRFSEFLPEVGRAMAKDLSIKPHVLNLDAKILSLRIEEING